MSQDPLNLAKANQQGHHQTQQLIYNPMGATFFFKSHSSKKKKQKTPTTGLSNHKHKQIHNWVPHF
jgi:hypothetical protein